ncbi:conserved protein of unknown function [Georgfuchsia toluolica]|uniref:Lipoprotein n=1 Tax=Georgfuchsia toluolica TaxID=424218 RepID=A0A916J544_9PROT|nr:hypothetical protein [Georgfuchsia toluolica]CAG4884131.1 conserved protein of unknown function [Georgfuchsia toluolica]
MTRFAFIWFFAIAMCGCISVDKYPDKWGAAVAGTRSDICPKLSGVYENIGETADGQRAWLASRLSGITGRDKELQLQMRYQFWKDLSAAKVVQIHVADNQTLAIKVTGEGIEHEWTVPKTRVECKTNAITIHGDAVISGDNAVAVGTDSMDLYRSGNQLILNQSGGGVGVLLLVPVVGYSNHWSRFSLIEE